MKKILLGTFLGISALSFGQNVTIPDPQFKAFLVSATNINTNGDSEIQVSEANAYTGTISAIATGFTDLTGIEEFTSLTQLQIFDQNIPTVDLTQNTSLQLLAWANNNTNTISLTGSSNMEELYIYDNNISNFDVTIFPALTYFDCSNNSISSIDFTQNPLLEGITLENNPISSLNLSQNTQLEVLNCREMNLTALDIGQTPLLNDLQCDYNNISYIDLTNSSNLQFISCTNNNLTGLDLSQIPGLFILYCDDNNLTFLNLANGFNNPFGPGSSQLSSTGNPNLTCIEVDDAAWSTTNWTNIDPNSSFSASCNCTVNIPDANFKALLLADTQINTNGNTEIECSEAAAYTGAIDYPNQNIADLTGIEAFVQITTLNCRNNQLTSLDVTQNTLLTSLSCNSNSIAAIDLSNNNNLTYLGVHNNALTSLDISNLTQLTELNCYENSITSLNAASNTLLQALRCNDNQLTNLTLSNSNSLNTLICYNNSLTSLDVSQHTNLPDLNCSFNQLTSLTLGNNTTMTTLFCYQNPIVTLDLTANTGLTDLYCGFNNSITSIDISQNSNIQWLNTTDCSQLSSLNVANGNNTNFNFFSAGNNPLLTCIQVDDAAWATTNWTTIDAQTQFSENCPSTNSLNELSAIEVSVAPNPTSGEVTVSGNTEIKSIDILDLSGQIIDSFNGNVGYLHSVTAGVYLLRVHHAYGDTTVRIIKK